MSDYDLVIKNGTVVVPGQGIVRADIGIRKDKIASLAEDLGSNAARTIDAKGKHVFPGFVDPHVHIGIRVPFFQDLNEASKDAASGGVTTFLSTIASMDRVDALDTPNPGGPPGAVRNFATYSDVFPQMEKRLGGHSLVDFSLRAWIGTEEHVDEVTHCYKDFGIGSYKFFTSYKDRPDLRGIGDGLVYHLLQTAAKIDPPPVVMTHCENNDIVEYATKQAQLRGMQGLPAWNAGRPNLAEEADIARMCLLARRAGCPIYIVHVSTAEGVEVVAEEQLKGTKVIGETCVHYLGLTEELDGVIGRVNPPLRKARDVDALWEGIRKGVITCVGSDHCSRLVKQPKQGDIWKAETGWPSMAVLLPAIITHALERNVSLTTVAELCSRNCARVFGLSPKKGTIAVGSDADLVVVDINKKKTVKADEFYSGGKYCPYDGISLVGWPEVTVVRGNVVFDHGTFGEPIGQNIRITPRS